VNEGRLLYVIFVSLWWLVRHTSKGNDILETLYMHKNVECYSCCEEMFDGVIVLFALFFHETITNYISSCSIYINVDNTFTERCSVGE
jgi:hypothetical protein